MSESERIKRLQSRVVYASYLIQKEDTSNGLIGNLRITSGEYTEMIVPGPTAFTPVELNSVLVNNNIAIPELIAASGMTVPSPPRNVTGLPGNTNVILSWSVPESNGGLSITKYFINVYDSLNVLLNSIDSGLSLTDVINNLTNGVTYNFTVFASNLYGPSLPSASISVIPTIGIATAPSAPTGVTGVRGNQQVVVSWVAPNTGGSAITSYTVTSNPAGFTGDVSGNITSVTATGLTNGQGYTFTVVARNAIGPSNSSTASAAVTPATNPGAPTGVSAVAGNGQATVSWTAPSTGGSAITGYRVTSSPGGFFTDVSGTTLTATVTGLTNGTPYTFTVIATNAVGPSNSSTASTAVTPATNPGAPTGVSAVAGNGQATVSWTAPSTGGSAITGYRVTSSPGGFFTDVSGTTLTATVTGLTNGTPYTFRVVATNAVGPSNPSTASAAVTPTSGATVPSVPTGLSGVAANGQVTVSWSAPANGGSAITGYRVTSSPGGFFTDVSGTTLTGTVTGLTNGQAYTFTVVATNAVGNSDPSAGISLTPRETVPGAPTNVTAVPSGGQATVSWSAPTNTGGTQILDYTVTSNPGGFTSTTSGLTALITGLTNGQAYTFRVVARNAEGDSLPSAASSPVTPVATVPSAPTNVTTTSGNEVVAVYWSAPADGGSEITKYTVIGYYGSNNQLTPVDVSGNIGSVAITGLTNGTPYTFKVIATNAIGSSVPSVASESVTPSTLPSAPTNVSGVAKNTRVQLSWTAPNNGGSVITFYIIYYSQNNINSGITVGGGQTTTLVPDLENDTEYTFEVTAGNVRGESVRSAQTSVTPTAASGVPGAPTNVTGIIGNQQVIVSWSAPDVSGDSAITSYTVISDPDYITATTTGTTATVNGLTNGTQYTFTVFATNSQGDSLSSTSEVFTPATVPSAPFSVLAVRNESQSLLVSWEYNNGGSEITSSRITAYDATNNEVRFEDVTGNIQQFSFTGLTNLTPYTFKVVVTNAIGSSPSSAASAPVAPDVVPDAPTNVLATPGNNQITVSWTAPQANGGSNIISYFVDIYSLNFGFLITSKQVGASIRTTTLSGITNNQPYICTVTANNSLGSSSASSPSSSVTPGVIPGIPQGVSLELAGNSSVRIIWATSTDFITLYNVNVYDASDTPLTGFDAEAAGSSTQVTIPDFTVGTLYKFTLKARNDTGQGQPTSPLSITVYDNPSDILISGILGDGRVTLNWEEPSYTGGKAIVSYTVNTYNAENSLLSTKDVSGNLTSTIISGLTNGTPYKFAISVSNGALSSNLSTLIVVIPGAPPSTPTLSTVAGYDFIDTSWTVPYNGGYTITSYTVYIYNSSDVQITSKTVTDLSSLTATFDGLTNGTTYKLSVTATNEIGTSDSSKITRATISSPSAPSVPRSVLTTPGVDQVTVDWLAPASNGGSSLTAYRVTVYYASNTQLSFTDVSGDILTKTITSLNAGLVYRFTVSAINAIGTTTSQKVSGIPQNIPGAVIDLSGTFPTNNGTLTWTPPSNNGGLSITYTITYTLNEEEYTDTSDTTLFNINALTGIGSYTYTVRAVNAIGPGPPSTITISYIVAPTPLYLKPEFAPVEVGNTEIRVTWTAPNNGGSTITTYTIKVYIKNNTTPVALYSIAGTERTKLIIGLTNGTTYNIGILATNIAGSSSEQFFQNGSFGADFNDLIPIAVPFPPTNVSSSLTTNGITVSWTAPTVIGDSAITDYTVRIIPSTGAESSVSSTSTSKEVTGLQKGVTYTFKVSATNTQGNSIYSVASQPLLYPATKPDVVTDVAVTYDEANTQIIVNWTFQGDGGSAITSYTVTPNIGTAQTIDGTINNADFTSVTAGQSYTFTVTATNAIGTSDPSAATSPVYPGIRPGAPTGVSAVAGDTEATISWTAPDPGTLPITSYTAISLENGRTVTTADGNTTTVIVTGLTNGEAYTFVVFATSLVGNSDLSAASDPVTPSA